VEYVVVRKKVALNDYVPMDGFCCQTQVSLATGLCVRSIRAGKHGKDNIGSSATLNSSEDTISVLGRGVILVSNFFSPVILSIFFGI
jgi:hypothetical protein